MSGGKHRMRVVRRYMCKNVICAQLLKVGFKPNSAVLGVS